MAIFPLFPRRLVVALLVLLAIALAGLGRSLLEGFARGAVKAAAARRGTAVSWRSFALEWPASFRATGLTAVSLDRGDTLLAADTLVVDLSVPSLLLLHPRPSGIALAHARAAAPRGAAGVDPDTLPPARDDAAPAGGPAAPRVVASAQALVRALLLPARRMPRLSWRDVTVRAGPAGPDEPATTLAIHWLEVSPRGGAVTIAASGALESAATRTRFEARAAYGADDRLSGGARLLIRDPDTGRESPLGLSVNGHVVQDRAVGRVRIPWPATVTIGRLALRVEGSAALAGPAFRLRLEADSITGARVHESLPTPVLGPLAGLSTRGSFDYRLDLDLDLAVPDSVRLAADVIPRNLALDPRGTRLLLSGLEEPFVAEVHLPRGRIVTRELSEANPHYRPLETLDSLLVHAVLTNEDGGFFRHRGFNEEAVREAIAHNLRAGAFRRGAGTITMQLARNLYLGHERTLARKGQEVVLAWVLEHLAGVSKRRLLEIYLNVIEWGPDAHGADEAARFYFDRDARRLTLEESLFLTIVIPSPARWRARFDREGRLRPFARAQMHFIGRAMVARGWLRAEELPPADALDVRLRGPARDALFPPDTATAGPPGPEPPPGGASPSP